MNSSFSNKSGLSETLQISLFYCITSGLSASHFRIAIARVAFRSPIMGNFTADLYPTLRILLFYILIIFQNTFSECKNVS
jgi:predicted membrane metal-binding protein